MIPGPDQVIACPHCGSFARSETLISGNNLGEELWTDLRVVTPMLPEVPPFIRCAACRAFYWRHQAPVLGEILGTYSRDEGSRAMSHNPAWLAASYVTEPEIEDYEDALRTALPDDRLLERLIRLRAFQRWNDGCRAGQHLDALTPDPPGRGLPAAHWQRRNLERLLAMIDGDGTGQSLLRAEIFRALGRFAEAKSVYAGINPQDFETTRRQLLTLCDKSITTVRRLR